MLGEPGAVELVSEFAQQIVHLAEPVGEMAVRGGQETLLQAPAGQQVCEGDGLGIGDEVAGGCLPPAAIAALGPAGLQTGRPQAFAARPGLVPPGSGDGTGDIEGLCADGAAVQQPCVRAVRMDDLRAAAEGHGQAAGGGQEQQPEPVAWADALVG